MRKPISKRKRFEIFKRDNFRCSYCGQQPPVVVLEIDHIVPVSKGGDNGELNLVTSCQDCNRGKSDKPLSEVKSLKMSVENAAFLKEKAAQLRAIAESITEFEDACNQLGDICLDWWTGEFNMGIYKESDRQKIRSMPRKFPMDIIRSAMKYTIWRNNSRYGDSLFYLEATAQKFLKEGHKKSGGQYA